MRASRPLSLAVVASAIFVAGYLAWANLPKLEYLPQGNQNLVFGIVLPPPGYNLQTMPDIATDVEGSIRQLWASETGPEATEDGIPKLDEFFFVAFRGNMFVGGSSADMERAGELIEPLTAPVYREPGTFGFFSQPSIFGGGIGGGRTIDLDISGPDLETVLAIAQRATGMIAGLLPREEGHQFRPDPGLELGERPDPAGQRARPDRGDLGADRDPPRRAAAHGDFEGQPGAVPAARGGARHLDMLTLLGFVILVGIVVNNAILLVHQTLFGLRENGRSSIDAIT